MRIIYMGTPEIASVILENMLKRNEDEIVLVVTQPDRPRGRGHDIAMSEVKKTALKAEIPIYQPEKIREPECIQYLKEYKPDMIVVAAFGQILPKEILEMAPLGCLNVHASLLPEYRGAAPIQWAIIDGKEKTGITIMRMDEGLDTGDMIVKREVPISDRETGESLHDKLAGEGEDVLYEAIHLIKEGRAEYIPQGDAVTHYASMLNKKMGLIDFTCPADEIERLIRGLNPWPSAYTYLNGKMLKILLAEVCEAGEDKTPGKVYDVDKTGFSIMCSEKGIRVKMLQPEGRKVMSAAEYVRGKNPDGVIFGN